jgi:hypothetical protein
MKTTKTRALLLVLLLVPLARPSPASSEQAAIFAVCRAQVNDHAAELRLVAMVAGFNNNFRDVAARSFPPGGSCPNALALLSDAGVEWVPLPMEAGIKNAFSQDDYLLVGKCERPCLWNLGVVAGQ